MYLRSRFTGVTSLLGSSEVHEDISPSLYYDKDLGYLPLWNQLPAACKIESVALQQEFLEVVFADQVRCRYPLEWLRDICRCQNCFNHITHNKRTPLVPYPPKARDIEISQNGDAILLRWQDGHESSYASKILLFQYLHSVNTRGNDIVIDAELVHWDANISEDRFRRYELWLYHIHVGLGLLTTCNIKLSNYITNHIASLITES